MGLFYTALERAEEQAANPDGDGAPAAAVEMPTLPPAGMAAANGAPVEEGAMPAPPRNWAEAAGRDLAGFRLEEPNASVTGRGPASSVSGAALVIPAEVETVGWDLTRLGAAANPEGAAKEQYRLLRTRLLQAMRGQGMHSLLITSAGPGEGKTLVSANLALEMSALGEARVLLVDADLRRAGLSASLRPEPAVGLSQYLHGEAALEEALRVIHPWLSVLPSLIAAEEAPELLASTRMRDLLQHWARERFDLILLDGAPVGPVADSHILARMVDASLLVVRARQTPTEEVQRAAEVLRPGLLGSVLNGARITRAHRYGGYGAYGYEPTPAAARVEPQPDHEAKR